MVATRNKIKPRCLIRHSAWQARIIRVALTLGLMFFMYHAQSQDFVNGTKGTYKGPGLFQVKGQATGLPDTVTGTFEYFGTDTQQVGAKNYEHLLLTGKGSIKTTTSNDLNILSTVAVAGGVKFDVSSTMTLEKETGRLTETGYVLGRMQKTVDPVSGVNSSDFGGMGLFLSWSGSSPGQITAKRTSGTALKANGKSSIQRFVDINAANNSNVKANVSFTFHPSELQGQNPATLDLWRSLDNGISWRRQRVSRTDSTLTRSTIPSLGTTVRWTAADANNLLGIPNFEWETDSLKLIAGNKQIGRVRKISDTAFVARVVDAFNQPVKNENVQFSITAAPTGAIGQSLTSTSAISDSLGQVQTKIQFGNAKGDYRVTAFVAGVPTAIDTFIATAKSSVAALFASVPKAADSIKATITPITITAKDQDSMAIAQSPIAFTINAPDENYRMTRDTVITDTAGRAATSIVFGKKSGPVVVNAVATDDPAAHTAIDLTALPGSAAKINNILGSSARDTVMKVKQFTINLFDSEMNPRQGDTVLLSWTKPPTSTRDSLFTQSVIIDTSRIVSVSARLGEKVGSYKLTATAKSKPELYSSQNLIATNDVPANMIAGSTSFTDTIGAVIHPLTTLLSDRYENAVPFASIIYTITGRPDADAGGTIDSTIVHTDSTGKAANAFTIGTKIGTYLVNASVNGIQDTFRISAKPGLPQKFFAAQGLDQAKEILSPLDSVIIVRLTDRANNPIQNDTVYFTITSTPSSSNGFGLSRALAVTDASGYASTQLTLGDKIGTYKVQATCRNINVSALPEFTATAVHGFARTLAYKVGRDQVKPILASLDTFVVKLKDIGGNPVPGKSIAFTVTDTPGGAWGYKLSMDSVVTDSLGEAKTILTLGSKVGRYGVVARTSILPSDSIVRFSATAIAGTAKTMALESGNAQMGQLGDQLNPFVVQVKDTGSNAVSNVTVNFSIASVPDAITLNDSLTIYAAKTDSSGQASTALTLGNRPGRYMVKASVPGVKDTVFSAAAIFLYSDVNHDNYRNIGDLTTIIDHVLGRRLLTGYDFVSADLSPHRPDGTFGDGMIDIRDAQACLDSLLTSGWSPTTNWLNRSTTSLAKVEGGAVPSNNGTTLLTSSADSCIVQTTYIGSRFSLKNTVPIKGLQAVIYLKNIATLDTADIIFPRASMMKAEVKSLGKVVTVVLWNVNNRPIEPGDSAIFRLPILLTNNNVDSIHVLMSYGANNQVNLLNSVQKDIRNTIPRDWMLYQNYPNPFNPTTTIEFDVPEVTGKIPRAAIQIFNVLGQHVMTIERGVHDAGRYSVTWDGKNSTGGRVASGVYFYRLLAGDYVSTKKMVMLK